MQRHSDPSEDIDLIGEVARSFIRRPFFRNRLGNVVGDYYALGFIVLARARELYSFEKGAWDRYGKSSLYREFKREAVLNRVVRLPSWKNKKELARKCVGPVERWTEPCPDDRDEVNYYFGALTERERDILVRFIGWDESMASIADDYNISREAVRQSKDRAISKIRALVKC